MLILYYHRVGNFAPGEPRKLSVEPEVFEAQMRLLKKFRCNFISADDAVDIAFGRRKMPRRVALITFDDGYADTLKYAFPLLKENGIPSVMFIATEHVGKTDWNHKLHGIMDWAEIKRLHLSGVTIGAHTKTHRVLTELAPADMRAEVEESKKIIEDRIDAPVKYFAYPKGVYNEEAVKAVQNAGYTAAFGTKKGRKLNKEHLFEIRRIPVSANDKTRRFLIKITKNLNWV
ncbi:MAG: polysaccharide deacetylase family protein [Planctomycetes bacterium]|nr:polysaccharide deacetylase family protein [Planctomycetota bacterium]